jgi:cytochrome c oxidase cbb3-type subunit 3
MKTGFSFTRATLFALVLIGNTSVLMAQAPAAAAGSGIDWLLVTLLTVAVLLFALNAVLGYVLSLLAQGLQRKTLSEQAARAAGTAGAVALLFAAGSLQAVAPVSFYPEPNTPGEVSFTTGLYLLLVVAILVEALVAALLFRYVRIFSQKLVPPTAVETVSAEPKGIQWQALWSYLLGLWPMDREQDLMTDHEYDGIVELDNRMPPWLRFFFQGTIVFAVLYLMYYHVLGWGSLQLDEYQQQVREGDAQKAAYFAKFAESIDENNVTLLTDAQLLAEGKSIFLQNCATCHGAQGQGLAGPNLTDDYWKHGGAIKDLFKVVRDGVQGTAMKTWGPELLPSQIQKVSSYIKSLHGTQPANALAPEGTFYAAEDATAPAVAPVPPSVPQ